MGDYFRYLACFAVFTTVSDASKTTHKSHLPQFLRTREVFEYVSVTNLKNSKVVPKKHDVYEKRLQTYRKNCNLYLSQNPRRQAIMASKNYTAIFREIAKYPYTLEEEAIVKNTIGGIGSNSHLPRTLDSLRIVEVGKKLGNDAIYCVPEKTGVSNWHRLMKIIDLYSIEHLFNPDKSEEMKAAGLAIIGGPLYTARYSFAKGLRKGYYGLRDSDGKLNKRAFELENQLEKFKKLLFHGGKIVRHLNVRHPFARLESAYRDKMDAQCEKTINTLIVLKNTHCRASNWTV